jgi:hypothetical protein
MEIKSSFNQIKQENEKVFVDSVLDFALPKVYESTRGSKEDKEIRKFLMTVLNQINNNNLSELAAVREAANLLKSPYTFYNILSGSSVERKSLITSLISAGVFTNTEATKIEESARKFAEKIKTNLQGLNVIDDNGNVNGKTEDELRKIGGIIQGTPDMTPEEIRKETINRLPPWALGLISAFAIMVTVSMGAYLNGLRSPENSTTPPQTNPTEQQHNKTQKLDRDQNTNNAPSNIN